MWNTSCDVSSPVLSSRRTTRASACRPARPTTDIAIGSWTTASTSSTPTVSLIKDLNKNQEKRKKIGAYLSLHVALFFSSCDFHKWPSCKVCKQIMKIQCVMAGSLISKSNWVCKDFESLAERHLWLAKWRNVSDAASKTCNAMVS